MKRNPAGKIIMLALTSMLILSGCKGDDLKRITSKSNSDPNIKRNATSTDDDGVTKSQINEDNTHLMQADGAGINGSEISFPPGSLAIGSEVSMQQGVDIVTETTAADLAMDSDDEIERASGALVVQSGDTIQAPAPFTIGLPIDSGSSLTEVGDDPHANIIVVYKIKNIEGDGFKMGTMLRDQLKIENTRVSFETTWFGSYQLGRTKKAMTVKKQTIVASPVMTKREEDMKLKTEPIEWKIDGSLRTDRSLYFQFNVSAIGTLESCSAIIDADGERPFDTLLKVDKPGEYSWKPGFMNSASVLVAFSCRGLTGMESGLSPWQKFDIPVGKAVTSQTNPMTTTNSNTTTNTNTTQQQSQDTAQ